MNSVLAFSLQAFLPSGSFTLAALAILVYFVETLARLLSAGNRFQVLAIATPFSLVLRFRLHLVLLARLV